VKTVDQETHAVMSIMLSNFIIEHDKHDHGIDLRGKQLRSDSNSYTLRQCIYGSLHSQVWLAWCTTDGTLVAIKLKTHCVTDREEVAYNDAMFRREMGIHARLDHPHILKTREYGLGYLGDSMNRRSFIALQYDSFIDLRAYMKRRGVTTLSMRRTRYVIVRVLMALAYLHDQSICHRDIKPSNVLVNHKGDVKLCDFGLSINVADEVAVTRCGSALYMAPEVQRCPLKGLIRRERDRIDVSKYAYSTSVDVYSVGAMTFDLLFGTDALRKAVENSDDIANDVFCKVNRKNDVSSSKLDAIEFMRACLHKTSERRLTCRQLLHLPWLSSQ
jgi:serine/threonine protein kinase